jgi:hypothetical protein
MDLYSKIKVVARNLKTSSTSGHANLWVLFNDDQGNSYNIVGEFSQDSTTVYGKSQTDHYLNVDQVPIVKAATSLFGGFFELIINSNLAGQQKNGYLRGGAVGSVQNFIFTGAFSWLTTTNVISKISFLTNDSLKPFTSGCIFELWGMM